MWRAGSFRVVHVAASGTPSGVAGRSWSHLRGRDPESLLREGHSGWLFGVAQRDRLRHLATRTELAGLPSVLRGQRSSERARPSWKPGAFRGVTEPAGGAPTGRLYCTDRRPGPSGPDRRPSPGPDVECCTTPVVVLKQPTPPQCIPSGGCKHLRVFIFGCCGFPASRHLRVTARAGTGRAFGHGRESAERLCFLREALPHGRAGRSPRFPFGASSGLPPGTASAMSNQVASGTSPREHRADVCGNTHGPQRTLRMLKALRSGDPQKRLYVATRAFDETASNGERETTCGEHRQLW